MARPLLLTLHRYCYDANYADIPFSHYRRYRALLCSSVVNYTPFILLRFLLFLIYLTYYV
jgi:hypothetical protein